MHPPTYSSDVAYAGESQDIAMVGIHRAGLSRNSASVSLSLVKYNAPSGPTATPTGRAQRLPFGNRKPVTRSSTCLATPSSKRTATILGGRRVAASPKKPPLGCVAQEPCKATMASSSRRGSIARTDTKTTPIGALRAGKVATGVTAAPGGRGGARGGRAARRSAGPAGGDRGGP